MAKSFQLKNLEKRLAAIPLAVREAVQPALLKSGEELASTMKHLAETSRNTGALIESITVTGPGQQTPPYSQPGGSMVVPELSVAVTAGNSAVRYAHLVEYGTADAAAQPFFGTAYRLLNQRLKSRIGRAITKAVKDGNK